MLDNTATAELQEEHAEAVVLQEAQLAEQAAQDPDPFMKNPVPQRHCPEPLGEPE